jgi:hypothetical protein
MGYGMGGMEAADGRRKKMIVKCKGRSGWRPPNKCVCLEWSKWRDRQRLQ